MEKEIRLRALEKDDLKFVHDLNNNRSIMSYWFEEPYEAYVELEDLYNKHIHDQSERRFIAETQEGISVGLVELVEINYIHRRAELQLIIDPKHQGKGYSVLVTNLAVNYAFKILNINKLYLIVAEENPKAIHVYEKCGFKKEGTLIHEFFTNGYFRDAIRMYLLQSDYLHGERKTAIDASE